MSFKRYTATLMAAVAASTVLSGCVGAVLGGAALGGSSALDRRTFGTQADDNVMETRIKNTAIKQLYAQNKTPGFKPSLAVVGYNRHILLLGHVATEEDKQAVERVARAEPFVPEVYNHISVSPQPRTFGAVSADTWSTSKVRASLLGIHGVIPSRVKIVTYDGVTYVLGVLTLQEQEAVSRRVSTTAGVQKVVTLYQNYNQ